MKRAISNIAWSLEEEASVAGKLATWGAQAVEVAPTRTWPDLASAPPPEVKRYRQFWADHGLEISSMQALLYGQPDLHVFGNQAEQGRTLDYLNHALDIGAELGADVLVFGSPKNRKRGDRSDREVQDQATQFFHELGERAAERGVRIGLEANPVDYHCDFLTDHEQVAAFVGALAHPGVVHHLDLGGAILAGDDLAACVERAHPMAHVHLSEPFLNGVGAHQDEHRALAQALATAGYARWISIETRRDEEDPLGRVEKALAFVAEVYGT